jgi:trehalose 6-phosphate synthase
MTDETDRNNARLQELCIQRLAGRRLVLASNRGPVEYQATGNGNLQERRGSGGVVTALSSLSRYVEVEWIASTMGEGDRQAARRAPEGRFRVAQTEGELYLRFLVTSRNVYHKYYSVVCNPILWFLQHYMWNTPRSPNIDSVVYDAWENGYVKVNEAFARVVVTAVERDKVPPVVMLNDYHLYLAADYIRRERPDVVLQHFTHIPWPSKSYWQLLPDFMRSAIHRGLCSVDIVGLQTARDVVNFLHCCQVFLPGAEVDLLNQTVDYAGRTVRVKAYPISIDVDGLKKQLSLPAIAEHQARLQSLYGEQTIVRVDRSEPSKNILRGFRAFDILLERYPEYRGKIKFVAFLVPTRTHLRQYQRYNEEIFQMIEAINRKYATGEWQPIDYFYENNYLQAIAGMRMYDVLLVNAVIDGMNLVAKEGPTVNDRNGVLILSETVGACEQLGEQALTVAATDIEGTVRALHTALAMSPNERQRRSAALKYSIEREDITNWLWCMLNDVTGINWPNGTAT